MDKRIVNTYVRKMINEDIDRLVNVFHKALTGDSEMSKAIPDGIAMKIEDYLDQLENEENEYADYISDEVEEMLSFLTVRGERND